MAQVFKRIGDHMGYFTDAIEFGVGARKGERILRRVHVRDMLRASGKGVHREGATEAE